ncbi:unnamed protein product [Ranitomeya imitator]|uniref:Uncharacterized protein n=1 Tax=Ranitomeya imitator TaxID=111125 RepID=A0ABN9L374_9NEOB|nr:unnamed protein product [Ranitomeya imitator]
MTPAATPHQLIERKRSHRSVDVTSPEVTKCSFATFQRVDHLLKQDCNNEALALAWSFHEGKAKAVVGLSSLIFLSVGLSSLIFLSVFLRSEQFDFSLCLSSLIFLSVGLQSDFSLCLSGDPTKRRSVVADKIVEILLQYTDKALRKCPEQGKIQIMEQHFQDTVPVIAEYCLLLQRTSLPQSITGNGSIARSGKPAGDAGSDILFSQMYDKLSENCVAKGVFLECLEPYLLRDQLPGLTTQVMKDLLLHFSGPRPNGECRGLYNTYGCY